MLRARKKTTVKGTCPSWPRRAKKENSYLGLKLEVAPEIRTIEQGEIIRESQGNLHGLQIPRKHPVFSG
jgi:hypothetical protein